MHTHSLSVRLLSAYFILWLAVPCPVWAELAITGPTFPATNTLRVGLSGAESTNAHIIFWTPTLIPDINSWARLTTGSVGQTTFDFITTTNRESYFRAGIAPVTVPTVATPEFSPGGGSYGSPTDVTISCGTAGAAIYYTTNGSTPTSLDTFIYSGASIHLASAVTLKARAFKSGYTDSAVASASYTINSPPFVSAGAQQILSGSPATLTGVVLDDGLSGGGTKFTNWSKLTGPGTVSFGNASQTNTTASFTADGIYALQLAASDGQYTNSATVTIAVNPTLSVSLVEPTNNTTVSVPTNLLLRAEAASTSGSVTQVVYYANGSFIGAATSEPFTYLWRSVPLGTNALTAVAFSSDADNLSLASTNPVTLIVNWPAAIGRVTLAETDVSIPTAGLPLSLNRVYDSRRGTNGQFGANGRLDIEDIRISKSAALSSGYEAVNQSGGDYIVPTHSTVVTVTLGTGEEYYFAPRLVFQSGGLNYVGQSSVTYLLPVRWVFDSLTGRGALASINSSSEAGMLNANTVNGTWAGAVEVAIPEDELYEDWTADEPDFSQFTFTAPDGMRYVFNSDGGLHQQIDRNGNTLNYDYYGIAWSNPNSTGTKQLAFVRDGENRITEVRDPIAIESSGPPVLIYSYADTGTLTNVARLIDRAGPVYENTGYAYTNATYTNAITSITDPRGVTTQRYTYDNDGRLTTQTDALNRSTSHTYDTTNRRQTLTDRLENVTVQTFTPAGQLASVANADGVTTYLYDGDGRRIAEINPLGLTNTYAYDSQDNLLAVTNELGAATSATYNEFGQVLESFDALNHGTTNAYDDFGNLIFVTNALGTVSAYGYDLLGNRLAETNALDRPEQVIVMNNYNEVGWLTNSMTLNAGLSVLSSVGYILDGNGNKLTETRPRTLPGGGSEDVVRQWVYDAANRAIEAVDPLSGTNRTYFNGLGKPSLTVDALNRTNRFDYDAIGLLTNTVFADGLNERYAYDAEGRRTQQVNRGNRTNSFAYDAVGRLTRTTYADGASTVNVYNGAGRLERVTQNPVPAAAPGVPLSGYSTDYGYDAAGRRISVTDTLEQMTQFAYDANGNQTNTVDALNRTNLFVHDALNRRIQQTFPDNTTETTGYDALDRRVAVTNQANVVTRFGFDALGRLISVTNAFGTSEAMVTRFTYDELGNLLEQIDALNRTNRFEYDALGRRVKETLPQNQSQGFAYDAVGNQTFHTNFLGVVLTNQFDALNRLTNRSASGGYQVQFAYNATGLRTNMVDASGVTRYTYDTRDRLQSKTSGEGTLNYTHTDFGNLATIASTTSGGVSLSYGYDSLNRLTNVAQASAPAAAYTFDAVGNLETLTYGNTVTNRYRYDSLNRLTNIVAGTPSVSLASFAYRLAPAGNRTNLVENINGTQRTNAWRYDTLYRLTNETITASSGGTISYKYDGVGNRTNRTSGVSGVTNQTPAYTANDWLTTDVYDPNGNTRTNGADVFLYDAENHLTNAVVSGTAVAMTYNGDGLRVTKTVSGTTTLYLLDDRNPTGYAQVLEEKTVTGGVTNLAKVYAYGLDLISQRQVSGNALHYYGHDGNGNVRYLTATNATISDTYAYEAFGNVLASTGSTPNDYKYSGEQSDPNLGFTYLRARYLNPGTGRFLTRDTYAGNVFDPPSLHRYTYVHNNPANRTDPSGRDGTATLPGLSTGQAIILGLASFVLSALIVSLAKSIAKVETISLPRGKRQSIYFHYSRFEPVYFVGGLNPPAYVTPVGGMNAETAMFSLGIDLPRFEYTFRIDPANLGPANNFTPGRLVQYEVMTPTGPNSLVNSRLLR